MSARLLLSAATRPATRHHAIRATARTAATSRRAFSGATVFRLKESASTDPSPEEFDRHKQDSLAKQRSGKGHWKPELASVSEESVKADRMDAEATTDEVLKRLQERTKAAAEETRKNGTSMKDGL